MTTGGVKGEWEKCRIAAGEVVEREKWYLGCCDMSYKPMKDEVAMNMQFISTKVHGYLDYLTAVVMPILPRAMGWDRRVTRLHDVMATATAGQSVLTNYELGLVKAIPMKTHLMLDAIGGGALLASAALMDEEPASVRTTMAGAGLLYLAVALMTQTAPRKPMRRRLPEGISPMEYYARQRRPEAAEIEAARI
ncbi:MAG: hypothetical protein ACM359_22925 [Bacillota bacterium]